MKRIVKKKSHNDKTESEHRHMVGLLMVQGHQLSFPAGNITFHTSSSSFRLEVFAHNVSNASLNLIRLHSKQMTE